MATTGTSLYNKEYKQIYPITHAEVTISNASGNKGNVEDCLVLLFKAIADITGDSEAATNIIVKVTYKKAKTSIESEIKEDKTEWSDRFELPTAEFPYVWKHTIFTYKGEDNILNELYEIVASDVTEKLLTIYTVKSTSVAPTIVYPVLKDGQGDPILDDEGNELEDLTAFDKKLPDGWSDFPLSIGPATPYAFMSTRTRVDGLWKRFSEPALYGRWAFDSLIELRYAITSSSTPPTLNANSDNPGSNWSENTPNDFTGRLWMITATSVNGVLNSNDGVRWKGPHLMSIIQ